MQTNLIQKLLSFSYWLFILVLFAIAGLAAMSSFTLPIQLSTLVVQSGSMEPAIPTGSIVFVQPQASYATGEVITYTPEPLQEGQPPVTTITHRIINVDESDAGRVFITKGDANSIQDLDPIPQDQVIGKVTSYLPYVGYPVSFAKTQLGFILLIVVPATIIVYSELLVLKNEVIRMVTKNKGSVKSVTKSTNAEASAPKA